MRRIAYIDQNGTTCIVQPVFNRVGGVSHEVKGFTDADAEKRAWDRLESQIAAGDVLVAGAPVWIDAAEVPTDRSFRAAWTLAGAKIDHDLQKVRAIAHDRRREARAIAFSPLDDIIAKRLPGHDDPAVEAARQAIRDDDAARQIAIDKATSIAGIKAALLPSAGGK